MKKQIKYVIWLVIIVFVAYNSVYFKKLSDVKAAAKAFNALAYAKDMYANKLPAVTNNAITLDDLIGRLRAAPAGAFTQYGHVLAIGTKKFFMVKGAGLVTEVGDSDVKLLTSAHNEIQIATEYVFGNAIRDASGLISLNDFENTTDLNNISSELDKIIRDKVIPPFKAQVKKGDNVEFTGAIELNEAHLNLDNIEVLPVSLKIIQ